MERPLSLDKFAEPPQTKVHLGKSLPPAPRIDAKLTAPARSALVLVSAGLQVFESADAHSHRATLKTLTSSGFSAASRSFSGTLTVAPAQRWTLTLDQADHSGTSDLNLTGECVPDKSGVLYDGQSTGLLDCQQVQVEFSNNDVNPRHATIARWTTRDTAFKAGFSEVNPCQVSEPNTTTSSPDSCPYVTDFYWGTGGYMTCEITSDQTGYFGNGVFCGSRLGRYLNMDPDGSFKVTVCHGNKNPYCLQGQTGADTTFLNPGSKVTTGPFTCSSLQGGVQCTNAAGKGFLMTASSVVAVGT